jgi:hypothetical protein
MFPSDRRLTLLPKALIATYALEICQSFQDWGRGVAV